MSTEHPIYSMPFAKVYPAYVNKAARKGRTEDEMRQVIVWLTGYGAETLRRQLDKLIDELAKGKAMEKILRARSWQAPAIALHVAGTFAR